MEAFHDDVSSFPFFSDAELFDGLYGGGFGGGNGHVLDECVLGGSQQQPGASTSPVALDGGAEEMDAAASTEAPRRKGDHRPEKAAMALKSHSEAERRRRERINAHLATLRTMVPCADKMDKAALLAEVITHVKKLKTNAARIRNHCAVPADADDVAVELVRQDASSSPPPHGGLLVKATLSCDDGAEVFADVRLALRPLRLRVVGSEVTTLGGRVRFTFLVSPCGGGADASAVADSVRHALQSVVDKANSALEFAPRTSLLNKRRRVSTFESSSSSS